MKDTAARLARTIDGTWDRWTDWADLPDGSRVRAKMAPDYDSNPFDCGTMGKVYAADGRDRTRPDECNGAARKFRDRGGMVWWQPSPDMVAEPAYLEQTSKRVEDYLLEDWGYVGLMAEVEGPPCPHCGERKTGSNSLWCIESDSGADYFAEVIDDLISECAK